MTRPQRRPVNPQRRPPLWIRGEPTADFLSDPRRRCIGKGDLYFEDTLEALAACQALCARCPLFQECTRYTLANFHKLEFGIFAGMNEHVRARIYAEKEEYYDWRSEWRRAHNTAKLANRRYRNRRTSTQGRIPPPPCVNCGSPESVRRHGRDKKLNRQRYQCTACDVRFLGEEL